MIHLSQGQLTLLETCPRKFQYIFLDQLGFPVLSEQQRLNWGDRFHRMMQQRELGLPVQNLVPADQPVQRSVEAFVAAAPEVFLSNPDTVRQSEHRRTFQFQGYLLTVIYDLVILGEQQAQILDWKTYPRPQQARRLAQAWQTRLYPFVLAETSRYEPEEISMTYWFIQAEQPLSKPEFWKFVYSSALHQQIKQTLAELLDQLTDWLQRHETGESFPQVKEFSKQCNTCSFALRCQRGQAQFTPPHLLDLSEIEEVVL